MSFETSATFSVVPELIPADLFHRASYKRRDVETEIIPSNCCHHTRVPLAVATGPALWYTEEKHSLMFAYI